MERLKKHLFFLWCLRCNQLSSFNVGRRDAVHIPFLERLDFEKSISMIQAGSC